MVILKAYSVSGTQSGFQKLEGDYEASPFPPGGGEEGECACVQIPGPQTTQRISWGSGFDNTAQGQLSFRTRLQGAAS